MEPTIQLTEKGPEFSRLVAGVWKWGDWGAKLGTSDILNLVKTCLSHGITTFDHADIYGGYTDEGKFGEVLKLNPALRNRIQLVTKCGIKLTSPNRPEHTTKSYDTSKNHIIQSVENSLKELNTYYIDLLLIHRPDPLMDPDEIAEAFETLDQQGKVLYFGVSNFSPSQFELLNKRVKLVTNQVQASLLHLDPFFDGTLDQCILTEVKPMVWSPLGSGKIFTDQEDPRVQRITKVCKEFEIKYEATTDQILLAWLLKHPSNILPILGTSRMNRIQSAVKALKINMEREDWFRLLAASSGQDIP